MRISLLGPLWICALSAESYQGHHHGRNQGSGKALSLFGRQSSSWRWKDVSCMRAHLFLFWHTLLSFSPWCAPCWELSSQIASLSSFLWPDRLLQNYHCPVFSREGNELVPAFHLQLIGSCCVKDWPKVSLMIFSTDLVEIVTDWSVCFAFEIRVSVLNWVGLQSVRVSSCLAKWWNRECESVYWLLVSWVWHHLPRAVSIDWHWWGRRHLMLNLCFTFQIPLTWADSVWMALLSKWVHFCCKGCAWHSWCTLQKSKDV